jgi:hypothetical protein
MYILSLLSSSSISLASRASIHPEALTEGFSTYGFPSDGNSQPTSTSKSLPEVIYHLVLTRLVLISLSTLALNLPSVVIIGVEFMS